MNTDTSADRHIILPVLFCSNCLCSDCTDSLCYLCTQMRLNSWAWFESVGGKLWQKIKWMHQHHTTVTQVPSNFDRSTNTIFSLSAHFDWLPQDVFKSEVLLQQECIMDMCIQVRSSVDQDSFCSKHLLWGISSTKFDGSHRNSLG